MDILMKVRRDLVKDLIQVTINPFSAKLMITPFHKKFSILIVIYYDDTANLSKHLGKLISWMRLYGFYEHSMCRAFYSTLTANSCHWFKRILE